MGELRDAREPLTDYLWPLLGGNHTDAETWDEISAIITADRAAVRAETVREICEWLREQSDSWKAAAKRQGKRVGSLNAGVEYAANHIAQNFGGTNG